jgi:hypothetical protein
VLTGGLDAEYGAVTGGIINIITKSGGDEFTVDASVYWQPQQLQLLDPGEINNSNDLSANLAIGGPIIRKKLWFFLSGQFVNNSSVTPVTESPFFAADSELTWPARNFLAFYGLAKVKWAVAPWQKLTLLLQSDPTWIVNDDDGGRTYSSTHPDALEQRFQGGGSILLTSETSLTDTLFLKAQVGYIANQLFVYPMACGSKSFKECNDTGTPGHVNQGTGTATISDQTLVDDRRYRLNLNSSLSYFLEGFLGDHELKAGLQGDLAFYRELSGAPGGITYNDNNVNVPGATIDGTGDPFQRTIYPEAV